MRAYRSGQNSRPEQCGEDVTMTTVIQASNQTQTSCSCAPGVCGGGTRLAAPRAGAVLLNPGLLGLNLSAAINGFRLAVVLPFAPYTSRCAHPPCPSPRPRLRNTVLSVRSRHVNPLLHLVRIETLLSSSFFV